MHRGELNRKATLERVYGANFMYIKKYHSGSIPKSGIHFFSRHLLFAIVLNVTIFTTGCSQISDKLVDIFSIKGNVVQPPVPAPLTTNPVIVISQPNAAIKSTNNQSLTVTKEQTTQAAPSTANTEAPIPAITNPSPILKRTPLKPHPSQPIDVSGIKSNDW